MYHAIKGFQGSRGIAAASLNLGVRLEWVVNATPWWGKSPDTHCKCYYHHFHIFSNASNICCILCVFVVPFVCIAVLTLDARLLARSQYPEGPVAGHLDTGFSWFPCLQANAEMVSKLLLHASHVALPT